MDRDLALPLDIPVRAAQYVQRRADLLCVARQQDACPGIGSTDLIRSTRWLQLIDRRHHIQRIDKTDRVSMITWSGGAENWCPMKRDNGEDVVAAEGSLNVDALVDEAGRQND